MIRVSVRRENDDRREVLYVLWGGSSLSSPPPSQGSAPGVVPLPFPVSSSNSLLPPPEKQKCLLSFETNLVLGFEFPSGLGKRVGPQPCWIYPCRSAASSQWFRGGDIDLATGYKLLYRRCVHQSQCFSHTAKRRKRTSDFSAKFVSLEVCGRRVRDCIKSGIVSMLRKWK